MKRNLQILILLFFDQKEANRRRVCIALNQVFRKKGKLHSERKAMLLINPDVAAIG